VVVHAAAPLQRRPCLSALLRLFLRARLMTSLFRAHSPLSTAVSAAALLQRRPCLFTLLRLRAAHDELVPCTFPAVDGGARDRPSGGTCGASSAPCPLPSSSARDADDVPDQSSGAPLISSVA